MKKLLITCCMAAAVTLPMAPFSTLRAEPPAFELKIHEHHPEIHETLHALENARRHLKESRHDFGGHREAALIACDNAIAELRAALEYDR